jgi:TrkA domain protein
VISRPGGHRELTVYERDDPDTVSSSVVLDPSDARQVADLLHPMAIVDHVRDLEQPGLAVVRVPVTAGSACAGSTLDTVEHRAPPGTCILAVIRRTQIIRAPDPELLLDAGDVLMAAGPPENISAFGHLVTASA